MERPKRYDTWLHSAKKHYAMGHIVLPAVSTRLHSTWKANQPQKLPTYLRFTVPKSRFGYKTGNKKEWTEFSKAIDLGVLLPSLRASNKNFPIFSTAAPFHTDLLPAFGQAPWSPGSLKKNSPSPIILPMYRAFFMGLGSPSSVQGKFSHKLIKSPNLVGFVISTPILKKSQSRRGNNPLRRRSEFPTRSHSLQNMVTSRFATGNTINWTTKHAQDFWYNRVVLCSISLSISYSLQCYHIFDISRTDCAWLFPQKDIFDSGQCSLSQRSKSLAMVCRTSQIYRGVQSPPIFSRVQRPRKNMASHSPTWYTQSVFSIPERASLHFDFDVSQYSDESITSNGVFTTLSINIMSLYLCNAI